MNDDRHGVETSDLHYHPGRVVLQRLVDMTMAFMAHHNRHLPTTYLVTAEAYQQLYAYGALEALSPYPLPALFTKDGVLVLWGVVIRIDEGSPARQDDAFDEGDLDDKNESCCACGIHCTGLDLVCSVCWLPMCDGCHEGYAGVCPSHEGGHHDVTLCDM